MNQCNKLCMLCCVQVHKASEATRLDQRRLVLQLDAQGTVLNVNEGATKALFGFNPSSLVGKRLAEILDVFEQWAAKYGEDMGLVRMLVAQGQVSVWNEGIKGCAHSEFQQACNAGAVLCSTLWHALASAWQPVWVCCLSGSRPIPGSQPHPAHVGNLLTMQTFCYVVLQEHGRSYVRVGLKAPQLAAQQSLAAGFLTQSRTTKPAVMVIEPIVQQEDDTTGNHSGSYGAAEASPGDPAANRRGSYSAAAASLSDITAAVLEVQLWRPENVTAVLEIDSHMAIVKADAFAGVLFGMETRSLLRTPLTRCVVLNGVVLCGWETWVWAQVRVRERVWVSQGMCLYANLL